MGWDERYEYAFMKWLGLDCGRDIGLGRGAGW